MKTIITLVALLSLSAFAAKEKPMITTYTVETDDSKVAWVGKKVTGQHNGTLDVKSGSLNFVGDELVNGEVVVDINSLKVEDITDSEYNAKFIGHMKSEDFFNTAKFPEAKLVIKKAKKTAKGYNVKGELTLLGTTKPVDFTAEVKKSDDKVEGTTKLVLDRTKWGLKYGSTSFFKGLGDKAIDNKFELTVNLTAEK